MQTFRSLLFIALFSVFSVMGQGKKFITYKVQEGETIQSIAKGLAITPYDLLKLNPDVDQEIAAGDILVVPNKNYDPLLEVESIDLSKISEKDIVVDDAIYHEVTPKETMYSLQKTYEVTEEELYAKNPFLRGEGLKIGQVLKIPLKVDLRSIEEKESQTQPYLVKAKETKYSIAKAFGISIEYLEELNPKIAEEGLKIDDVILVPIEVKTVEEGTTHTVAQGETIYSLTHKYGISVEELTEENPELSEGLKVGMVLNIPATELKKNRPFEDPMVFDKDINLALMLPFKSRRDSVDFKRDRLLNITMDFYFGSLLAVNQARAQGLKVNLNVYDTENKAQKADLISRGGEFVNFDAVIGPLFLSNIERVSNNLRFDPTLVVSPISSKDHSAIQNEKLVQQKASTDQQVKEMLAFIKSTYEDQNLIVIKNESEKSQEIYGLIEKELKELNLEKELIIMSPEPEEGYIKPEEYKVFRDTLDRNIVNWFLLTDDEPSYLGDVFQNLGVFPEADSLMVFAFQESRHYEKIDNNFLSRVHFHYPSNTYLDLKTEAYKNFAEAYRKRYRVWPSEYAVDGYDVTLDLLMRLSTQEELLSQGWSERISTRYNYIENTSGSLLNNGIYILKYDQLELRSLLPMTVEEDLAEE